LKAFSLTTRLSLLFALSAAVVLLALGWVVVRSVEDHLLEIDRYRIEGKLALVGNLLAKTHAAEDLSHFSGELDDALVGHHWLGVTVVSADGTIRYSNDGWHTPPIQSDKASAHAGGLVIWEEGERLFRGLTTRLSTGLTSVPSVTVTIAMDISDHQRFIRRLRRTLAIAMALATFIMAGLGWAATWTGLRPLQRLTALIIDLEASRLDARLPAARMPAEVETLAVAFNAMLARLEDSFRRLQEFSSDIAHELRTPVTNLMVQAQVALSNARTVEEYREVLYSSLEEYERMARTIGDMLFLAQADQGLLRPTTTAVDLKAVIQDLFDYLDAWAEERGVRLVLRGAANSVPGDSLMLRRALSNLLTNAIRHTPVGGAVQVDLEMGPEATRITVENPGPTIADEHLGRLFDRFYRVDPARHRQGEGAGLGLSIVKSIVDAHGGTINVTSSEGRTQFLIVLPNALRSAPECRSMIE
jgi:two-component system heavy metal sensor histidine kinase CusS